MTQLSPQVSQQVGASLTLSQTRIHVFSHDEPCIMMDICNCNNFMQTFAYCFVLTHINNNQRQYRYESNYLTGGLNYTGLQNISVPAELLLKPFEPWHLISNNVVF